MTVFDMVIWGGAGLTVVGLGLIVWCILSAAGAKRAGLTDEALRQRMQKVVAVNMAALALSFLGLIAVTAGVILR